MDTINRLQFRHHNEIFETREDAIEYIYDKIKEEGEGIASGQNSVYSYSLFAEPTILRYKNDEEETGCDFKKGPHIMLVIGSETNDTIYHDRNRFCIIDIDKTEEEIKNLEEELAKVVKSLTLAVFDTSTLDLHVEKTDDGTFLSGDVKTAETHVFEGAVKDNNLMVVPVGDEGGPEGLFIYVDLTYDDATETFTFIVSQSDGTLKKTSVKLPNNYLVSGEYKRQDESLHLKMRSGDEVVINCEELIAEWGVEGDASKTPIVLTREEVDYDHTDEHHHVEPWQDVLRADVRLANDRPANILKKTTDGRYLYVDGVASNILYYWNGERSNVEEQLNKLNKIRISPDNDNIIWNRADGFFASTKLDYNSNDNKLIFTTSTVNGQPFVKEIQLNTVEVIESITYDPTREVLVVKYKNDKGETKTIYVPVSGLIDEWEVLNDAHSVKLVKQRKVSGKDILTADVNISIADNNILEERGEGNIHALFVRGTADNIKYNDTTVEGALDALAAEDEAINEKLDEEIARSTAEDEKIETTIGSGFSTDAHETVTYKFEQLQNQVNSEAEKLQDEIDRSTEKDEEHDDRLDEQQAEIEAISADSKASLKDIINNDHSINVDKTDPVRPVIKVNLSTEVEDERKNIIKLNNDGLFSNVDLSYIKDSNKLIFHTSNDEPDKEIQLESMSSIISIEYNPTKEAIVIKYMTNGHEIKTVEIPVGDLINEWRVEDGHPNAVELKKDRVASGTSEQDILRAKVIITEDHDDNILKMDDGALYVPGYDDDIADIYTKIDTVSGDVISEIARAKEAEQILDEKVENEITRAQNAETALQNAINAEEARAISAEAALGAKIDQEIADRIADVDEEEARAETEEQRIDSTIGSGFTTDTHETVTYKFEQLQNQVNSEAEKLQNEIDRSTVKDNEHDNRLNEQQAEIEAISADSKASLKDIINNDHSIDVDKTDPVKPVISVNLSEHQPYNTIRLEGDGLYNFIDLRYDSDTNKLTFVRSENGSTENVEKEIQLNSAPFDIRYDKDREVLIITYHTSEGDKTVEIDLHDLIHDEWTVRDTNTIELHKDLSVSGSDILTADVKICHHEDNAIEEHNDGLYVHSYSGEIADLGARIDTVSGDVISEKSRAEEAESNLANSITTERDRAIAAENGLHDEIEAERRRAEAADTELHNAIQDEKRRAEAKEETLANSIGDEVIRATNAEENLSHLIDDEAERRISGDSTLRNDINSEITRSTNKDNEHDTAISNLEASAHSLSDRILQEAADRDVADASLRELINTEKSDRVAQDTVITERLTNEINRSTAEDDRLNAALQQEIADRVDGDAELEQAIRDATLTFKNTVTAKMNKSATNEVTTDVIVPTDDNIIIIDEGIKAMVKLLYDAGTNKLMLEKTTASGHTWDTVQLNAGSIIQSIEYDSHTKELVIKYEKTSEPGVIYETRVNVEDLFNPWLPNNPSEKSAIELGLVYGAGPLGEDLLSARTLITDDRNGDGKPDEGSDNVIEIRNNGLYVSNSAATIAECVSGKTDAMYKAIFGSAMPDGCGENIVYTPDPRSCVLSAATSFAEADSIMGYEICRILDMWTSGLTCSAFAEFVDNPISDKKEIKVDLRSSHGKGNIMTDDDIYITDCDAKIIEPGVSEFTDTNALRIVCLENCGGTLPDLKDNQNGIYLSNVWDCGKYYDRTNPTDMAGHDAVDADGYNANYWVDNDASAIDYSNYLRC